MGGIEITSMTAVELGLEEIIHNYKGKMKLLSKVMKMNKSLKCLHVHAVIWNDECSSLQDV